MSDVIYTRSMRQSIAALDVGESYTRAERLELEQLSKDTVVDKTAALRNTVSAAMRRAASDTGNEYTVETASLLTTTSRDLMLVAIVTRRN